LTGEIKGVLTESPFSGEGYRKVWAMLHDKGVRTSKERSLRLMRTMLRDEVHSAGRGTVRRLMRKLGLMAVYAKPRTSKPHPEHTVYPYLLRVLSITRPNHV